jgi:ring-1,2-phenylacetyl-CoA epoxidase subunit PaaE
MSTPQFHALKVSSVTPAANDALCLSFEVPLALQDAYRFSPGQHLTLRMQLQGQDVRRAYSICAGVGEALSVGVRRVPGGVFSEWLHHSVKPGDTLDVMTPDGRFGAALDAQPQHVLLVAGGSGITPMLSIIKTLLRTQPGMQANTRCTLVYGNRDAAGTMFKEELDALKDSHLQRFAKHLVFSRENADSALHSGRIDAEKVADFVRLAGPVDAAFVCGPHAMNDDVQRALLAAGIAPHNIHIERFGIAPAAITGAASVPLHATQSGDARRATVTLVRDGLRRDVPFGAGDDSILAAAARAGLDMPYSCRSGVCATCRAKVLEGQIRMDRNFALEPAEVAAGFVLTCQAHPLTERVVLSFDDR